MPFSYRNLMGVTWTKKHRIFILYDSKPEPNNSHLTGFIVDDRKENMHVKIDKIGREFAPKWYPGGAGVQEKLI